MRRGAATTAALLASTSLALAFASAPVTGSEVQLAVSKGPRTFSEETTTTAPTTTSSSITTTTTTTAPPPPPTTTATTESPPPPPPEPPAGGGSYADPALDATWDRLAQCESGGNWSINTGNGYYGGLQFSLGSWQSSGGTGMPHEASREEQIRVGRNLQAAGGWVHWPACTAKLGYR